MNPAAAMLSDGTIFITYLQDDIQGTQVLIWATASGEIIRETTVNLPGIVFAFAEGTNAVLVKRTTTLAGLVAVAFHSYDINGNALPEEVVHSETLPPGWIYAGSAFHFAEGQFLMLIGSVDPDAVQNQYRARILRRLNGTTAVYDPLTVGPVPPQRYATNWAVGWGPWGSGVVGYVVAGASGQPQYVWVQAFDSGGESPGVIHSLDVPAGTSCNGVSLLASNTTVYVEFTTFTAGNAAAGAYVAAFPLNDVLAGEDAPVPVPARFALEAYPNPFNAAVRLDYELAVPAAVKLTIFDLQGREVAVLAQGRQNAGRYAANWTADNLPSGLYLARLSAGEVTRTQKLVLLK